MAQAIDERVAAGTLDKMVATAWGQGFWFDLVKQFYASEKPADFVLTYCMEKEHYDWCLTSKEVGTSWEGGL